MVRDKKTMKIISILLYCEHCKTDTKHVLTTSGKELVCACGTSYITQTERKELE